MNLMTDPVRVFDKGMKAPVDINGALIGAGSSRRPDSSAWAEISVYKLDGGSYLVHRSGMSLVYHRADTPCTTREGRQRGDPASVEDLPDDAQPCPRCQPEDPEYLPDGNGTIRFEFPRHTFDQCDTPEQVVSKLTVIRHRDKSRSVQYSQPVTDCLEQCARNDVRFAVYAQRPVTFGDTR